MSILHLTEQDFEDKVLKAEGTVLVDFWADWCGPCKMLAPILDEVAQDVEDSVTVAKVNVDDNQQLAMKYQVMSIPTLLVFKNGEVVAQSVGLKSKPAILNMLK